MKKILLLLLLTITAQAQERARVNLQTGDVIEYSAQTPTAEIPSRWMQVIRQPQPAHTTNQFLVRAVSITNDTVTISWTVQNKTQEQLDQEAQERQTAANRQAKGNTVVNAIGTLRQWADDARNTTVTSTNVVQVVNVLKNRLATFWDRFADLMESDKIPQ